MASVERFDLWRQRATLTELADQGGQFLNTAEGLAFIEQLTEFFAPGLKGAARGWGYDLERDEVVNMIVEQLLATRQDGEAGPARYAATAENPWAYLWACAVRWGQEQWGTRGVPIEAAEMIPMPIEDDESPHTPIQEVVDLTFALVAQVTPEKHHVAIRELLMWTAVNPPQRLSYETDERRAAHRMCPTLTLEQVIAVMKIARGSRPRAASTSLMGQFLLDPDFRVSSSASHARALTHFKNEFRAGETGSRMLSDWITHG
ncbi:hypothetical protein NHL51_01110 [Leucobacter sp. gxy201]|uniref:hypothetical protein n=1 Tax=Leucobacter sp. gxy201 TaxID=2957200 RepID=UPI003DA15E70